MIDIIKMVVILVSLVLLVGPYFLIKALNTGKNMRYKQLVYPGLALVYFLAVCIVFFLLNRLMEWFCSLPFMQAILQWLAPAGKLDYVVLLYGAILINALLLIGFALVKSFGRLSVSKKRIPEEGQTQSRLGVLYWRVVDWFYDMDKTKRCPRGKWIKIHYILKYASWILAALYLLLVIFLQLPVFADYDWIPYGFMYTCLKTLYLWPVLSLILVNECRWFLEGKEKFAGQSKMVFDRSSTRKISDYSELAQQYQEQFPERFAEYVSSEARGNVPNFYNEVPTDNQLLHTIAQQLRKRGYTLNPSFLTCIRQLSEGKHALIDASVFSDFGEYLFLYLNALLARGENVLFLCPDEEAAQVQAQYISEKFHSVNNYHRVWIVKDSQQIHSYSDADILVLTPQFVLDDNVFISQQKFLKKLSTVVMINTAEVIAKDGAMLALLAHKLSNQIQQRSRIRSLRYICLSESVPPETSNALKQILNLREDIYVCDGYQAFDNTHLMLWNYESGVMGEEKDRKENKENGQTGSDGKSTLAQDNLFGDRISQTYWGVALPIACVGMKYTMSKITVISHSGTPYVQILNSMKNQVSRLEEYFKNEITSGDFDETILVNRVDHEDSHTAFLIVEDDLHNLPLCIYNYCRFGGTDTTMIHIISKPYMLRDFFVSKAKSYISNESEINMIVPELRETTQIIITKLLCEASDGGVEENDFRDRLKLIDDSVQTVEDALKVCRDLIFPDGDDTPVEYFFAFKTRSVFVPERVDYENRTFIHLKQDTPLSSLLKNAVQAKMKLRSQTMTLGIFAGHLHQHFVPSQSFVHRGNLYTVESIDADAGVLHVQEASDRLNSPVDYVQVRTYEIRECSHVAEWIPVSYDPGENRLSSGYEVSLHRHVNMAVDTVGYYALNAVNGKLDLCNGPAYKPLTELDMQKAHREYTDGKLLSFRIKGVGADKSDKTAFLLAVMMNEMLKTIFPYSHKCIAVCPVLADPQAIYADAMGGKIKNAYPQVVFSGNYDHDPADVEVLILEDSVSDVGMIKTLLQDEQYPFSMIFETVTAYLTWYENFKETGNISNKYLFFGGESLPDCFDAQTLKTVCREFETVKRRGPINVNRVSSKGQCSYCHRDLFNVEYREIKDNAGKYNRKLCAKCAKLLVTDEDQLLDIYQKVRSYLCEKFGISLSNEIHVRFATAEKIRKKLKTGDRRMVLGFADPRKRELWVEADAPAPNVADVLIHELTHFWQFDNLVQEDLVYMEGHASYVEVQYMLHENRKAFAQWQDENLMQRQDEYGEGYRRLKQELDERGDHNSFSYMLSLFGEGGTGRPQGIPGGDHFGGTDDPGVITRTPDNCPMYAYNMLPDGQKAAYEKLRDAMLRFQEEVDITENGLNQEDTEQVLEYIRRDHPEIFWLGTSVFVKDAHTDAVLKVTLQYCMTKATAVSRQKKIEESLKPFFDSVTPQMSDYEIVEKIYENVIALVDYDSIGLSASKKTPDPNKPDDLRSIYGVFVKKKAVCAGYARALQYLLNRMGIECTYVKGYTPQGYHAWNLLKLEGDYYYMDVTWGDWSNTDKKKGREGIDYDHFCITTKQLLADHTPDADYFVPECTATKCNYHIRHALYLTSYSYARLRSIVLRFCQEGKTYISLKFADEGVYDGAYPQIIDGGDMQKALQTVSEELGQTHYSYRYIPDRDKLKIDFLLEKN